MALQLIPFAESYALNRGGHVMRLARFAVIIVAVFLCGWPVAAGSPKNGKPSAPSGENGEKTEPLVLRVYDVSDVMPAIPSYAAKRLDDLGDGRLSRDHFLPERADRVGRGGAAEPFHHVDDPRRRRRWAR
jgi:hypothetical protein